MTTAPTPVVGGATSDGFRDVVADAPLDPLRSNSVDFSVVLDPPGASVPRELTVPLEGRPEGEPDQNDFTSTVNPPSLDATAPLFANLVTTEDKVWNSNESTSRQSSNIQEDLTRDRDIHLLVNSPDASGDGEDAANGFDTSSDAAISLGEARERWDNALEDWILPIWAQLEEETLELVAASRMGVEDRDNGIRDNGSNEPSNVSTDDEAHRTQLPSSPDAEQMMEQVTPDVTEALAAAKGIDDAIEALSNVLVTSPLGLLHVEAGDMAWMQSMEVLGQTSPTSGDSASVRHSDAREERR